MLFKYGSGTGTDFPRLRQQARKLRVWPSQRADAFLRVYDAIAALVKSRWQDRGAPPDEHAQGLASDIKEFIEAKQNEEKKAWA